jgi:hypothetical protein
VSKLITATINCQAEIPPPPYSQIALRPAAVSPIVESAWAARCAPRYHHASTET